MFALLSLAITDVYILQMLFRWFGCFLLFFLVDLGVCSVVDAVCIP